MPFSPSGILKQGIDINLAGFKLRQIKGFGNISLLLFLTECSKFCLKRSILFFKFGKIQLCLRYFRLLFLYSLLPILAMDSMRSNFSFVPFGVSIRTSIHSSSASSTRSRVTGVLRAVAMEGRTTRFR